MWRWPSLLGSTGSASAALAVLLAAASVATASAPRAWAAEPVVGPTSSTEASILWSDARKAYQEGRYEESIRPFQRLLDRYPGYPNSSDYQQIRLWLGRAMIETGQFEKAIDLLRAYLDTSSARDTNRDLAIDWRGDALIRLKRYHEAYLTSVELERDYKKKPTRKELGARALILKSRALLGLNESSKTESDNLRKRGITAERALSSALTLAKASDSDILLSRALTVDLEGREQTCSRFWPTGTATEAEVRTQVEKRGTCLGQMLPIYRQLLDKKDAPSADHATEVVAGAYRAFWTACANPPHPPRLKPSEMDAERKGDRTPEELQRYLRELSQQLTARDCAQNLDFASGIAKTWLSETPQPQAFASERIQKLRNELEKTREVRK